MGELIQLRRVRPPVAVVCGLYVGFVDEGWYVFRWSTQRERHVTGLHFQVIEGPLDDKPTAERCARRQALRPVAAPKENHDT